MVLWVQPCGERIKSVVPEPDLYQANPHFADGVNHNIIQSEIDGGVYLRDLACGALLEIETHDWDCTMIYCGAGEALVRGHAWICPDWAKVYVCGSTWGGSMLKEAFVGRGMCLEFLHPRYRRVVTSPIIEIRVKNLEEHLDVTQPASGRIASPAERHR